jgi:hypothetical protein
MKINLFSRTLVLLGMGLLSLILSACSASSQGLNSRSFDVAPAVKPGNPKSQPAVASAPVLNLDLSVDAAYAAIPHRRTAMDFASSNMPDQDRRFLEVAFHLIDQAIRLRVSTCQKFSSAGISDSKPISDMNRLIDHLQSIEAPDSLAGYQAQLLEALSDQRAFFEEWRLQGREFQYASSIASHPRVQSASTALRSAYGILMQTYPNESSTNKEAFFDYHCALDFI